MKRFLVAILLAGLSTVALHGHTEWDGGIEGGTVVRDSGNATLLRLKLSNNARPLSHYIYADWTRNSNGDNGYELGYKPQYWFAETIYLFAEGRLRADQAVSIDNEQLALIGIGSQLIATPTQSLWVELGAGQRETEFDNGFEASDTLGVARAGFSQTISDAFRLELDGNTMKGETLTETTLEAGITLRISSGAVKYSYQVRRLTPDGSPTIEDDRSFLTFSYGF